MSNDPGACGCRVGGINNSESCPETHDPSHGLATRAQHAHGRRRISPAVRDLLRAKHRSLRQGPYRCQPLCHFAMLPSFPAFVPCRFQSLRWPCDIISQATAMPKSHGLSFASLFASSQEWPCRSLPRIPKACFAGIHKLTGFPAPCAPLRASRRRICSLINLAGPTHVICTKPRPRYEPEICGEHQVKLFAEGSLAKLSCWLGKETQPRGLGSPRIATSWGDRHLKTPKKRGTQGRSSSKARVKVIKTGRTYPDVARSMSTSSSLSSPPAKGEIVNGRHGPRAKCRQVLGRIWFHPGGF